MAYLVRKTANINGQDTMLSAPDIECALHRTLTVREITDEAADAFNGMVRCLARDSKEPITLYINSPGGSVSAGMSMHDTLKASGCEITTVACGMAASMGAFLLAAAGTKGKRWAQPNAEILIHQPLGGTSGQASDMAIHVQHILEVREKLNRILAECTGQPIEKIAADTERDKIMSAEEALSYGLIDRIGDPISEW